jgi:hypothetical protein
MAKKTMPGVCCICLKCTELTYEHVPPQAAFNNKRVEIVTGPNAIELPPGLIEDGDYEQRGMGAHTLCAPCNNNTGTWYGAALVDWCRGAHDVLLDTSGKYSGPNTMDIYPLRVIKQIVTMLCSVRGVDLVTQHPDVQQFLLDKTRIRMPTGLRVYIHYAIGSVHRYGPWGLRINTDTGHATPMSEFVWPPFGYLLTYDEPSPDPRPIEITHWARHGFDDHLTVDMNLPLLCTLSPMPGDYQTPEELEQSKADNDRYLAEWRAKRGG